MDGGREQDCDSYAQARAFYLARTESTARHDDDDTSLGLATFAGLATFDSSSFSSDPAPDTSSGFDSGGGDFGGGGSSGDF